MQKYSIESIKEAYSDISEVIISLDEEGKVVLSLKKEIVEYIKGLPLRSQISAYRELINLYNDGFISETYLKDYFPKISFNNYFNSFLNTVKSEIDIEIIFEDYKSIEKIKSKLSTLVKKDEKINFLLILKNNFEGDFSKEVNDNLKNDSVYLFIKKELKFWKNYKEINDNESKIEIHPRIKTNLTIDQRGQLFDLLKSGGFITDEYRDYFNWAIGTNDEKEPSLPGQWKPIKWLKTKSLLAYFVNEFNLKILGNIRVQWKPFELIFNTTNLRGSKNDWEKTGDLPKRYEQIENIINKIDSK
ncbi:MAG: hypothetical protein KA807_11520 [Prolixibacteraceae bacterium]|nr:hypothetical protein [Prolixibacteraceae bacterium]